MNCNCAICSDLFSASDDVHATPCGHVFHHDCLVRWIQRSKSCPQCRKKTTLGCLKKIYFNCPSTEGIQLDAATLQAKLDTAEFQLKEKNTELEKCREEKALLESAHSADEDRMTSLREEVEKKSGIIEMLKEKLEYAKAETKELSRARKESNELREKLEKLQRLRDIIDGTPSAAEDIVNKISDPRTLNTYIVVLKKAMVQTESKKRTLQETVRSLQNELGRIKNHSAEQASEISVLESNVKYLEEKNKMIESELIASKERTKDDASSGAPKRKSYSIFEDDSERDEDPKNSSIIDSSQKTPRGDRKSKKVKKDDEDDVPSPYLLLKRSTSGLASIQKSGESSGNASKQPELYILKNKKRYDNSDNLICSNTFKGMVQKRKDLETDYNGFGGHSKLDIFPVASSSTFSVKKSFAAVTNSKPKKNKRLVDFKNQNRIDNYCDISGGS